MYVLLKILFTKNTPNLTRTWIFNEHDARKYMEILPKEVGKTISVITDDPTSEITVLYTATKIS